MSDARKPVNVASEHVDSTNTHWHADPVTKTDPESDISGSTSDVYDSEDELFDVTDKIIAHLDKVLAHPGKYRDR